VNFDGLVDEEVDVVDDKKVGLQSKLVLYVIGYG